MSKKVKKWYVVKNGATVYFLTLASAQAYAGHYGEIFPTGFEG